MVMNCEQMLREISNYLDGELDAAVRSAMDEHFRGCQRCTSLLAGMRNVVTLFGDERMVEAPLGLGYRLQRRLAENSHPTRRTFFGWLVAGAAAALVAGSVEAAKSFGVGQTPRSAHARATSKVPPDMMVLIYPEGKTFHVAGCTYILDRANLKSLPAREAMQEGYVPCVRCMKEYLG